MALESPHGGTHRGAARPLQRCVGVSPWSPAPLGGCVSPVWGRGALQVLARPSGAPSICGSSAANGMPFSKLRVRLAESVSHAPLWAPRSSLHPGSDARCSAPAQKSHCGREALIESLFRCSNAPCSKCSISSQRVAQQWLCASGLPEWASRPSGAKCPLQSLCQHRIAVHSRSICAFGPLEWACPSGAEVSLASAASAQHRIAVHSRSICAIGPPERSSFRC